ncbi:MAG TPA: hypothetical protein PK558_08275, partial [Anaerolineaceae bacterium]|nr:hypothetical protein [Anaerolineaceae bacterium]
GRGFESLRAHLTPEAGIFASLFFYPPRVVAQQPGLTSQVQFSTFSRIIEMVTRTSSIPQS